MFSVLVFHTPIVFILPYLQVPDLRRDVHVEPLELLGLDLERGELGLLSGRSFFFFFLEVDDGRG